MYNTGGSSSQYLQQPALADVVHQLHARARHQGYARGGQACKQEQGHGGG